MAFWAAVVHLGMIYITQNIFISFFGELLLLRITVGSIPTPKKRRKPWIQTTAYIKSGQKQHASGYKHACKNMQKIQAPQSALYAAPIFVAFSALHRFPEI